MALGILKTTKIDVCLLGILIVSLAYQVRKNHKELNSAPAVLYEEYIRILDYRCPTPTPPPSPPPTPLPSPFPNLPPRRQKKVDECCRQNLAFLR